MTNVGTVASTWDPPSRDVPHAPVPASRSGESTLQTAISPFAAVFALLLAARAWLPPRPLAGPPSDTLLPNTTKGYVSVAQPTEFEERWDKTQIGQMFNDEVMQPFVEDFRKQLQRRVSARSNDKLGLTWDDLNGVTGRRDEPCR